jgi:SAM-dependent methyltransferase
VSEAERREPANSVGVYGVPLAYEVAFSYRDVPAEVDALLAWHGGPVTTALEVAAGPGDHALELARRGIRTGTLDLSAAMCERVAQRAADAGLVLAPVVRADMVDFALDTTFDLIFCLIDSLAHVLTLDQLITHLTSVRRHLAAGGAYIVETLHPADAFRPGSRTETAWTAERDGLRVHIRWGDGDEPMDPLTQVSRMLVSMDVTGPQGERRFAEVLPQRFWTRDELDAAARLAGLRVAAWYGDYGGGPLDGPHAWRMLTVFRAASARRPLDY